MSCAESGWRPLSGRRRTEKTHGWCAHGSTEVHYAGIITHQQIAFAENTRSHGNGSGAGSVHRRAAVMRPEFG